MTEKDADTHTMTDSGSEVVVDSTAEEPTIQTILRGVAAAKGVSELELDPLYEHVDTTALQNLLEHASEQESSVSVQFSVDECTVSVRSDDSVEIVDESASPPTSLPDRQ